MDLVTAVGLVASLVQLVRVTAKTIKYLSEIREAPKDVQDLSQEAANVLALLNHLRFRIKSIPESDPWFLGVRGLGVENGLLEQLQRALEELAKKLKPRTGVKKLGRTLLWTIDKGEFEEILRKIERCKTSIGFALQEDTLCVAQYKT